MTFEPCNHSICVIRRLASKLAIKLVYERLPLILGSISAIVIVCRPSRFCTCVCSVLQGIVGLTLLTRLGLQKVSLLESVELAALAALPHLKDLEILGRERFMTSEGLRQLAMQSAASLTQLSLSYLQVSMYHSVANVLLTR